MKHPNIDLVQELYAAYLSGDRDRVTLGIAPDIRWHNSGYDANAGTIEGLPAVLDYLMGEDHLEDYRLDVVDMLASDERVAIVAAASGRRGRKQLRNDFVQVMRVQEGRVVEVWNYNWDQRAIAEALPAAV